MTACGVASTRRSAFPFVRAATLLVFGLFVPGQTALADSLVTDPDFIDDQFEAYYLEPCLADPLVLAARGWTADDINEYTAAICSVVFSGSFSSSEAYQSTSNVGAVGAQSRSSDTVADRQQKSVEERLAEIKVEEPEDRRDGIGLLLAVQTGETERASTNREVGYDSDLDGMLAGLDYRFGKSLVAGFAAGFTIDDASFEGGGGFLETESRSLTVYMTYALDDSAYIDAYVGMARLDYDTERNASIDGEPGDNFGFTGSSSAKFDGDQTLLGASIGYDWFRGNLTFGVNSAIDYRETEVDDYNEEGNTGLELEYPEQKSESLLFRVGATAGYAVSTGWGTLTPNVGLSAVREEENDSRSFSVKSVLFPDSDPTSLTLETDDPDRDYALASVGVVLAPSSATQVFVNYEEITGHKFLDTWTVTAGFLTEF